MGAAQHGVCRSERMAPGHRVRSIVLCHGEVDQADAVAEHGRRAVLRDVTRIDHAIRVVREA